MGVTGLWRLIEPAGKPVPLETLENKVLAVDISIWLHQMVKGYQDPRGGIVVNAHLLGLFQRLCKLLYYRIKPVFVFDGGVPILKIQTISKRQNVKNKMHNMVDVMRKQLLEIVTKQMAIGKVISEKNTSPRKLLNKTGITSPENDDNLFKLPPVENKESVALSTDDSDSEDSLPEKHIHLDLHSLDVHSQYFKNLTLKEKHDLLTELKETRKQSSWGKIHELPSQSDNFSDYQMQRLLKRRQVQVSLEEVEKEMGGHYLSINELEILLNEEGIDTKIESLPTRQIASNESAHFVLVRDVKEAIENATKKENNNKKDEKDIPNIINYEKDSLESEYEDDIKTAIKLSLECCSEEDKPSCSKQNNLSQEIYNISLDDSEESEGIWETESESEEEYSNAVINNTSKNKNLALVKAYMLENSGLSEYAIKRIIKENSDNLPNIMKKSNTMQITDNESIKHSIEIVSHVENKNICSEATPNENKSVRDTNQENDYDCEIVTNIGKCSNSSEIYSLGNTQDTENSVGIISDTDSSGVEAVEDMKPKQIEINLNIQQSPKDDDIFADVFKKDSQYGYNDIKTKTMVPCSIICNDSVTNTKSSNIIKNNGIFEKVDNESKDNYMERLSHVNGRSSDMAKLFSKTVENNDTKSFQNTNLENFYEGGTIRTIKEHLNTPKTQSLIKNQDTEDSVDIMSDTDSYSFEDVEDIESKVEINLNIQSPPEDDIFSDVFESSDQEINDNKIMKTMVPQKVSFNDTMTDSKTLPNDKNYMKGSDGVPQQNVVSVESSKEVSNSKTFISTDSTVPSLNNNDSNNKTLHNHTVNDSSPKKGMTLNEIRYLVASEDAETKAGQQNTIDNQLISTDDLITIANDLEKQKDKLKVEQSKLGRMGRNISEEMTRDAQSLLKLFGIPYIVAPMEAEAQCAFLEIIKLTDGTITDDSDIWLFGGRSVYKNFFNQQKYVLQFLSENIQNCFKLSREQLVLLALLVGSDYTTGLTGVGPVTALEILSTFPPPGFDTHPPYSSLLQGLKKFKGWWNDNKAFGHNRLRSKLKNITINPDFPNYKIVEAYLDPQIDKSSDSFTWGKPDVTALREFTKQKFGWSQNKTDEILKPVLKRLDEKISQQSIRAFFKTEIKTTTAADNMSKRVRKAVERMEGAADSEDENKNNKKPKKRCKTKNNPNTDTDSDINNEKNIIVETQSVTENQTMLQNEKINKVNTKAIKCSLPPKYSETIPQRENDKNIMMKNRLKAIEIFRTSRKGPGFIAKQKKVIKKPKLDAGLSESDSD